MEQNVTINTPDKASIDRYRKLCEQKIITIDGLTQAIQFCIDAGSEGFAIGEQFVSVAQEINKNFWSEQLFEHVIMFFLQRACAGVMTEQFEIMRNNAYDISKKFEEYYPDDEKGIYYQAYILSLENSRKKDARDFLYKYILRNEKVRCSRCCRLYLELDRNSRNYKEQSRVAFEGYKDAGSKEERLFFINQLHFLKEKEQDLKQEKANAIERQRQINNMEYFGPGINFLQGDENSSKHDDIEYDRSWKLDGI